MRKLNPRQQTNAAATFGIVSKFLKPNGVYIESGVYRKLGGKVYETGEPYTLPGRWLAPAVNFAVDGRLSVLEMQELEIWGNEGMRELSPEELTRYDVNTTIPVNLVNTSDNYLTWWQHIDYKLDGYQDLKISNARVVAHKVENAVLPAGARGILLPGATMTVKTHYFETFLTVWPLAMADKKRRNVQMKILNTCWLFVPLHYRKYEEFSQDILIAATFAPYILPVSHECLTPVVSG